jgi:hypothetical protein
MQDRETRRREGFAMSERTDQESLPETRRKEIFLALVETQDQNVPVAKSRTMVAERFGVSEQEVSQIEREGLNKEWPPL